MYERLSKRVQGRRDEGFTLIELLIVIVILGILAAIVVFAVGATRGDAVASACKTDVASIQLAADAGKTKLGKYPTPAQIVEGGGGLLKDDVVSQGDYTLTYTGGDATYTITATAGSGGSKNIAGTTLSNTSDTAAIATFCAKA